MLKYQPDKRENEKVIFFSFTCGVSLQLWSTECWVIYGKWNSSTGQLYKLADTPLARSHRADLGWDHIEKAFETQSSTSQENVLPIPLIKSQHFSHFFFFFLLWEIKNWPAFDTSLFWGITAEFKPKFGSPTHDSIRHLALSDMCGGCRNLLLQYLWDSFMYASTLSGYFPEHLLKERKTSNHIDKTLNVRAPRK